MGSIWAIKATVIFTSMPEKQLDESDYVKCFLYQKFDVLKLPTTVKLGMLASEDTGGFGITSLGG